MKLKTLREAVDVGNLESQLANLENHVNELLAQGEIVKPEYARLKAEMDRAIDGISTKTVAEPYFHGKGDHYHKLGDDGLADLLYGLPHDINSVLSLKNKLSKVKLKDEPVYKATLALYDKYKGLAEKMKQLKTKVVTTIQKRQEKKEGERKEKEQKFNDSSTLVKVLEEHMGEYIQKAVDNAEELYSKWMEFLEQHGWDLDQAAPRPHSNMSRGDYKKREHRRNFLTQLTTARGNSATMREPSQEKKEHLIKQAKQGAHDSYMQWVHKIIGLVGKPVESATMTGDPWVRSVLKVKTVDGEEQTYLTKMILNRSKYDLLFNQFPVNRIK